jgi:hypothetical protein
MTRLPEGGNWGFPSGDCFAGSVDKFHQVSRYFTKFPSAEGLGPDALALPWSLLDPREGTPLLWVFPPREILRAVVGKIAQERKNCILVVPNMPASWKVWMQHLPIKAERVLPPKAGMFVIGSRFPRRLLTDGDYRCHLTFFLIRYEQPVRPSHSHKRRRD